MEEFRKLVSELQESDVSTSHGMWISDGASSWQAGADGSLRPVSAASESMIKMAAALVMSPPHPSVHNFRKRKMHVHIGGPRGGLSEITVVEVTPHGVVRNRFYRVRCDEHKVFRKLTSLARIKHWGNLFKMITALRHLV